MQHLLANDSFTDIYVHDEGGQKIFCYRSGTFVYEECLAGGRLLSGGFNGAGFPLNVLEDMPVRLPVAEQADSSAFCLEVDGTTLELLLSFSDFQKETEVRGNTALLHGILTLESQLLPVTVRVHTYLDGTPMMERRIEVINRGSAPVGISRLSVFSGCTETGTDRQNTYFDANDTKGWYSLGTMQSSMWGCEGLFSWQELPEGALCICGKYGRDRHRHPAFFLRNNLNGSLFFGQLAYAGGYELRFDKNTEAHRSGCNSRLSWQFSVTGPAPLLVIAPEEGFTSPAIHLGMVMGDLDDAVNATYRHLRKSVFTLPDARGVKGWLEAGIGPERTMDMDAIRHFADTAAEVGAEALIIDAGWYCPPGTATREWGKRTGDWHVDPALFPNGIEEARDYVHSKGLLFGLWMEPERMGVASKAAAEHPEFLLPSYITGQKSEFLDLTNEAALALVEAEITRVIEEYKLDIFRLDHNTHAAAWFTRTVQNGKPACGLLRQVQAVEELYRRLRLRFPDVIFENCSAGGGRTDIGMVQNFTHTWVSDWNTAPRSVAITNGMTMVLPPEYVDRLVGGMFSHTRGSLDLQLRHTLFGRPTTNSYEPLGSLKNPVQRELVRHTFAIYKDFIRPFAGKDLIFHHTPEVAGILPRGVCVLERAAEDASRAVIGVFHLTAAGEQETRVFPRGIRADRTYRVTYDNSGETARVSGYALRNEGILVRVGGSMQSELLLLEEE